MKRYRNLGVMLFCCLFIVQGLWAAEQNEVLRKYEQIKSISMRHGYSLPQSCQLSISRIQNFLENGENLSAPQSRSIITRMEKAAENLQIEMITQDWENGEWVNKEKDIMTFDEAMEEIFSLLNMTWDGANWVNFMRLVTKQDANGLITEMGFDSWRNGKWMPDMLTEFTFDAQKNLTSTVMKMDMDYDGTLENQTKTTYVYNAQGQMTQQDDFMWDNGAWVKMFVTEYVYNAQGQLIEEILKMDVYGYVMNQGRVLYTYHANGEVETEVTQTFELVSQTYTNAAKTTYEYNGNKQVTVELDQIWEDGKWVNQKRWSNTFDGPDSQVTESLWQEWVDGAWLNIERTVSTYDAKGNEVESVDQLWENGEWVNFSRDLSKYNEDGFPVETITQLWENGEWVNDSRTLSTYPGGTSDVLTEQTYQPGSFALTNYPNPFNPSTTIQFSLPLESQITLQILDIRGRTIRTLKNNESVSAGLNEVVWNGLDNSGNSVPSGMYLYRLTGDQIQATGRCLLNK